jgi:hypothetical protein
VERVQGEQGGDKGALPAGLRHPMEDKKEQQRVCKVEEQVRHMVPSRLHSKELNIQHMGDPGYGVPVRDMTGRECPSNPVQRNTVLDMTIFRYIERIVKINEIAAIDLPECHKGGNREKQVNRKNRFIR